MAVILGLNCYKHDAAAALLVDGVLTGAVEEERFRRQKHYADYPSMVIDYLLEEAGLGPGDVEHVAYYMKPGLVFAENMICSRRYILKPGGATFLLGQINAARKMSRIVDRLREHLGREFKAEIHFVEHHQAHAVAGLYCSDYEEAAVLTMDGVGERETSILASFTNDGHRIHSRSVFPNSPGIFYSALTKHLGFQPDNDEYKVMGLSSYGNPEHLGLFRKIISASKAGKIRLDTGMLDILRGVHHARFRHGAESVVGHPRQKGEPITPHHQNIASSAQTALEETGLALARFLREASGQENLVISGGVALNCVMNGRIERESGFASIYPFPAPHDAGTSIGAAVMVHRKLYPGVPLISPGSMYLGPGYSEKQIEETLQQARLSWTRPDNLEDVIAQQIEAGKVIALFQGRMEFGPRALGNRSILADPRRNDMKDIVNSVVKHREAFRPFAPSCLEEYAGEYFTGCKQSRYMIKTYPVSEGKAEVIPAVTHVDGTARVQTVTKELNPFYYDVIDSFYRRTGVPVLLNTSFNVRGEPIVTSPVDAVRCFYGTGIDILAMPPFLLRKQPQSSEEI